MSSFSSGRFAVYKNTTDNKLKKNVFCPCRTSLVQFTQFNSVRRFNYSSMVLHAIKENLRCAEAFLLRTGRLFYCFLQIQRQAGNKTKKSSDKLEIPCGTKLLRVVFFTIFAIFPAIRKNNPPPPPSNYRKHFSRKNLLQSIKSLTKIFYYTKIQH